MKTIPISKNLIECLLLVREQGVADWAKINDYGTGCQEAVAEGYVVLIPVVCNQMNGAQVIKAHLTDKGQEKLCIRNKYKVC